MGICSIRSGAELFVNEQILNLNSICRKMPTPNALHVVEVQNVFAVKGPPRARFEIRAPKNGLIPFAFSYHRLVYHEKLSAELT